MDISLLSHGEGMISLFTTAPGSPSMLEIMTTVGTALAGINVYCQRKKDQRIAEYEKHIAYLQAQVIKLRADLDQAQSLIGQLRINPLGIKE